MSKKDLYLEKAHARLRQLDAELEKLEARMDEVEADARIAYRNAIEDARARRSEARDFLRRLRDCSDEAWDDLARGLDRARDEMETAVKKAASRFE